MRLIFKSALVFIFSVTGLIFPNSQSQAQEELGATGKTLSNGSSHTCVVTDEAQAKCWGDNNSGQASVPQNLGRVTAIAAGSDHSCAVTESGTVQCWGSDEAYQLDVPESVSRWGKVLQITAGDYHTCVLTEERIAECWGLNSDYQAQTLEEFVQVAAGAFHTCALKTNGEVKCWGDDSFGQSSVPFLDDAEQITAGRWHTCVVRYSGEVLCWGDNSRQQSTNATIGDEKFVQVAAGSYHTCGLKTNGEVTCWGSNGDLESNVPSDLGKATQISAGWGNSCAVQEAGTVLCWGSNEHGKNLVPGALGKASKISLSEKQSCIISTSGNADCWEGEKHCFWNGEWMDSACYEDIGKMPTDLGKVNAIAVGDYHTCAITTANLLKCWGSNNNYQLEIPKNVGTVKQVSAFGNITCALNDQGKLNCWGYDFFWVQPAFEEYESFEVTQVSLGERHYCVLEQDSTWCWGDDEYDQSSSFLVQDSLDGQVSQVAVGSFHTCAVTKDGSIFCWGDNRNGQTEVPSDLGKAGSVTTGSNHSCAITLTKTVRCWGENEAGQLDVPADLTDVVSISASLNKTCSITVQGTVRCWGALELRDVSHYQSYGDPVRVLSFKKEFEVLTSPTISGSMKVGTKLTAKPGNIIPTPDYTYEWFKFKKDWDCWCKPISIGPIYIVKASDLGYSIAFTVTAKKSGYLDYSEDTKPKLVVAGSLLKTPSPKILGVAKVKQSVSTLTGSWDSGVTLSYQWLRNGVAISKATSAKYKLTAVDKGKKISVKVTGKKLGYQTVIKTSIPLNIK